MAKNKDLSKMMSRSFTDEKPSVAQRIRGGISKIFHIFDNKLTIMIVPHSQGKVMNLQTNVFAMVLGIVIVFGILLSFIFFNKNAISSSAEISRLFSETRETMASLDELRDENQNLFHAAKRFQSSLDNSLSLLGLEQKTNLKDSPLPNGDLASLFGTEGTAVGSMREISDVRQLASYLESAVQPIEQIGKMLETQNSLFSDIPSIWPLTAPQLHISMAFGPNIHPITGQWYVHKGLDMSTWRSGDPIRAPANGQVVTVNYDAGYGMNIIIKHKHGIYTRYAHMSQFRVKTGDFVSQNQVIGLVGNTGVTTGPHLHYEVHVGNDVVDPMKYLNIR